MKGDKNIFKSGKNNKLLKFLIGAGALLFFILIINFFSLGIRNNFYALSSPVQKTFWAAGESCSQFLTSFVNAGSLSRENQNLKDKNQKLLSQVAVLQSIQQGNQAQSDVSSACQGNSFKLLMAGIVGLDDQDMISLNKGSADGISVGMPVINQQGALYGKIFKVYKNLSQVMLISNKNSIISVKVQQLALTSPADVVINDPNLPASATPKTLQAKEIDGVIKGTGNMGIYLDLVPIDDVINQGDILVTSALEGTFPKDLLVGTISKIQKNDQNPHQQAQVQPFLNSSIDNLFVITNYKK